MTSVDLRQGDCLAVLRDLPDNSVDAVVTDPPYGLSNTDPQRVADTIARWASGDDEYVPTGRGFMGASWDGFVPPPAVWKECMRVLKPGGHMAVFAGARTQDLMGMSIRLAGFDIRDGLSWITGTGFPKGQDIGKQIDKMKGAKREVVGRYVRPDGSGPRDNVVASKYSGTAYNGGRAGGDANDVFATAPATDEARKWDGWGTALKPAIEPIILARKPLDGTVANNVLAHGVGGLNIDASRVATDAGDDVLRQRAASVVGDTSAPFGKGAAMAGVATPAGRFPANVLLDEHAAAEMDKQSGVSVSRVRKHRDSHEAKESTAAYGDYGVAAYDRGTSDEGGASRFFPVFKYQAKAPKKERPVIEREDGTKIQHPTVKPLTLLEWLVTLITPPGGTVLDPFAGSGTTLEAARNEGFNAIGIEREPDYCELIHHRLNTTTLT